MQCGFDERCRAEHGVVVQRAVPEHEADRQLVGRVAGQRQGAAVEQVDERRIAQQRPLAAKKASSSATSGASSGATIGTVGESIASKGASAASMRAIQSRRAATRSM